MARGRNLEALAKGTEAVSSASPAVDSRSNGYSTLEESELSEERVNERGLNEAQYRLARGPANIMTATAGGFGGGAVLTYLIKRKEEEPRPPPGYAQYQKEARQYSLREDGTVDPLKIEEFRTQLPAEQQQSYAAFEAAHDTHQAEGMRDFGLIIAGLGALIMAHYLGRLWQVGQDDFRFTRSQYEEAVRKKKEKEEEKKRKRMKRVS